MVVRRCLAVWLPVLALLVPAASAQIPPIFRLPVGLPELQEFARTDSNEATGHFLLGLALWNAGRPNGADSALRHAVYIDPRYADAYLAIAILILQRAPRGAVAQFDEAVRLGRRARMINPLVSLPVLLPTTLSYVDDLIAGRYQDVHRVMEYMARRYNERRHPERVPPEIRYYRGLAASSMDLHAAAIRDFEALLEQSLTADTGASLAVAPIRTNELRYLLAFVHHRAGGLERARQLYREAGENDFGLYMAHVQLAGIYVAAGQFDSAIVEREAAVNSNPDDSSVQVDLALTLMQADRDFDAVAPLHRAAQLNPHDARVPYLLGVLAEKAGRRSEARREFERFIAMAPSRLADQVTDAQRRLGLLQGPP